MKKRLISCVICAALLLALCPAASAADGDPGFYRVGTAQGIEVIPVTDAGDAVAPVSRDADGDGTDDPFYPGSQALDVTLTGTAQGEAYLLTVFSPEKTLYADQQTGGGDLRFHVAFTLPERQTELSLAIGSTEAGFERIAVSLFYTPSAPPVQSGPDADPSPSPATPGRPANPRPAPAPAPTPAPEPEPDPDPEPEPEPDPGPAPGYASCGKGDACPMRAFLDLDPGAWYHDGVHWALENGIMSGLGGGRFAPSGSTSRGMIVTILWHLEGMPDAEAAGFRDVAAGSWYAKAVDWAASSHVVEGYGAGRFGPDDPITREQLAVILWHYATRKGTQQLRGEGVGLGAFVDTEHISAWAYEGMQWAVGAGLISGTGNEHLNPQAEASRAQAATVLMGYSRLG